MALTAAGAAGLFVLTLTTTGGVSEMHNLSSFQCSTMVSMAPAVVADQARAFPQGAIRFISATCTRQKESYP